MVKNVFGLVAIACGVLLIAYLLGASFYERGTEYAPGYTEAAFQELHVGYTKEDVIDALGKPLRIVGDQFIYRYLEAGVNYTVDTRLGSAWVTKLKDSENRDRRDYYERIESIEQLLDELGAPDAVLRAQSGQATDEDILSLVYSESRGLLWNYRLVYVSKSTNEVVGKHAERRWD
jgi:hypothetical protein